MWGAPLAVIGTGQYDRLIHRFNPLMFIICILFLMVITLCNFFVRHFDYHVIIFVF